MKNLTLIFLLAQSLQLIAHPFTPCNANTGMADIYPCEKIDLMTRLHIDSMGGTSSDTGADIWGWTDSTTGKEYALMTMNFATAFVDISDRKNPIYLGKLNTASSNSLWRDIKTYQNYAFIVSEANNHGMQVFDLTKLRNINNPPVEFTEDAHYSGFSNAHNIVINEATGFAYAVGTNTCSAGLDMINIQNPLNPAHVGCFSADGYTHDAQCVIYSGPDSDYSNQEICFNANEDTLTIVKVTDKSNPVQISRTGYSGAQYTHQGWLTEDQRYYLMNDELDEQRNGHKTRTYIWDLINLDAPQLIGFYNGPKDSIDHNLYIKGHYAYLTNYTSGLRIVDISDIGNANLTEVASFDGYPASDSATFNGAWSNYPYFASGNIIMSDYQGGLFILQPKLCPTIAVPQSLNVQASGDNSISLNWNNTLQANESYSVYRSVGGCAVDNFEKIASNLSTGTYVDNSASGGITIGYKITTQGEQSYCESARSTCVETTTTGSCTAAPQFTGISSVTSSNTATCGIDIQWNTASSQCGNSVKYNIYRSTNPAFTPNSSNQVASNLTTNQWHDSSIFDSTEYYYNVRASDTTNQSEDNNVIKLADTTHGIITNGTWSSGAEIGDTGASRHVGWQAVTTKKHSGNRSYWSQNENNSCNDLTTKTLSLTAGQTSQLSFWTAYDIENQYDGGVVEITTGNNQWNQLLLSPNYPGSFNSTNDGCSYSSGTPSFTGNDLVWKQHTVNLNGYQGQDIKVRFNYSSDTIQNGQGWYIDDIAVTNTQVYGQCTSLYDLIFSHGFEIP